MYICTPHQVKKRIYRLKEQKGRESMSSRHELQKHSERCKVSAAKEGYMDVGIQERITGDGVLKENPGQYGLEGYKNICFYSLPDNIAQNIVI